jgi:hypothetical protein
VRFGRRRASAPLREEDGRGINPDDLADSGPGRQRARNRPRPAPDLENARIRWKLDVREVRLPHLLLLLVGRTKLQNVHQSLDDRRLGLGNGGVDVRHG